MSHAPLRAPSRVLGGKKSRKVFPLTQTRAPVVGVMGFSAIQHWLKGKALQLGLPGRRVRARGYGAAVGRQVDVEQLVAARTITDRLGYRNVQVLHFWRNTDDSFPEPVFVFDGLRGARLWYWPDVEAWAKETGRLDEDGTPHPQRGGRRKRAKRPEEGV